MTISPRWLIGLFFMFITFSLLCGVIEAQYLAGSDVPTLFDTLMHPDVATYTSVAGQGLNTFSVAWTWLQALVRFFTFDYSFFTGDWVIVRMFFIAIGAAMVVTFVLSLLT